MQTVVRMGDLPARKQGDLQPRKNKIIRMSDIPDRPTERHRVQVFAANRKVGDVLRDGAWKGQRCFIVGGGESANNFDLKTLEGEHVIGINLAFRLLEPEIIYGMDARLWGWIENDETGEGDKARFDACRAVKVWSDIAGAPLPEDIVVAPALARTGLSKTLKEGLANGTNSGFGALNLALLLGASPIYLIGFDFYGDRWHAGYPQHGDASTNDYHRVCYEENSAEIAEFGARIVNLNPKSRLKIFEFGEMPKDLKPRPAPVKGSADLPKAERKKGDNEPVFVSYYTPDNGYKAYADEMKASLDRFGLAHDVQPAQNRGDWDKNTKFKPAFILGMLDRHRGKDVVWIDADAVVLRLPEILLGLPSDTSFACRVRDTGELISSVMFFRNDEQSRELLRSVQKLIESGEVRTFGEQKFFQEAVDKLRKKKAFKFVNLPEEYCDILGISRPKGETVIEMRQASRSLKT